MKLARKEERKKHVNMRMDPSLISAVKRIAAEAGKPYQTLIREWVTESVKKARC